MNLDQLRVFAAVAEHGHVTRAAEALGMSQSAASASIKALEDAYAVLLFNRVGRGIELSQAGALFLPEARALLDRAEAARLALLEAAGSVAGTVAIAASQTIASHWLPSRLAAFRNAYPAVRLDVTIGNTSQVEAAVISGAADIGLAEGRTHSDLLRRVRVDEDRLVMVVPADAAAVAGPVRLDGFHWVVRERGSGTREVLEDLASGQGLRIDDLRVVLVLPSNEAIRHAVEAGAGASIISSRVVGEAIERGAMRAVPLDIAPRDFVMITHRDRGATLTQKALKEHLAGMRD